jgi:hypothetical protein
VTITTRSVMSNRLRSFSVSTGSPESLEGH